ncbi:hypothetical protein [Levilactobacillus acidifarinae]|nr:hypothetical protein [Levilactobacillus acidifarinae]
MKREMTLGLTLALATLGLGTTNAQAAVKRTSRPQVTQFFTAKNIKASQKNQRLIERVADQNRQNQAALKAGQPLKLIEPVVYKLPYTGLIRSARNSIVEVRQGKQRLFKETSTGVLVFNTQNWKGFSADQPLKVYAKHAKQRWSHPRTVKLVSYDTVLK